ncbi:S8 family serine peptidase [Spirosoma aureum]|uniref:S8 family serine peptidase n=1 Tax=Spirosoma aureum TaxID=2692134 RepID=A0A6G9AT53_9BACT|nr:S8 family serine peptidase [Spirosoma aureum]QIP15568.1 S8 family serine peptidase [Spirosoma aureum]
MQLLLQAGRGFLAFVVILLCLSSWSQAQDVKQLAKDAKVSPDLYAVITNNGIPNQAPINGLQRLNLFNTVGNTIAIEAAANSEQEGVALLQALQSMGLQQGLVFKQKVSGYLPIDQLGALKSVSALKFARPSYKPRNNVGSVTSQGDVALRADVARSTYNVTGAGVKIGVLSDSYNALGGAPAGVTSGDLPAGVEVLEDITPGTDEGRAMIELIHDIAPGSPIAYHTAYRTELNFAQGIRDLATAGCKIITDDVSYFLEPFFQDGVVAQAVDDVVNNQGVTYFSAAANSGRASYQATFNPAPYSDPQYAGGTYSAHNFGGGDIKQSITIPGRGAAAIISFQWDDPFFSVSGGAGAQTDMDLLVYYNGTLLGDLSSFAVNTGGDPTELIGIQNNGSSAVTLELVLVKYSGPNPSLIKWVNFADDVTIEYDTKSSTIVGHANSTRGIAVGAAPFNLTPAFNGGLTTATIEPFSSVGGTPILFNTAGQRISQITRQKPEITSVDGTNTTFFVADSPRDTDAFPNFFGTSAAAPHAAAVAALMKEKGGNSLSSSTILSTLQQTALDMDDPFTPGFDTGFDYGTGFGFIQADKALQAISGTSSDFSIAGVTTITCTTISAGQRTLTFNPTYAGLNSQPISFSVVNELSPTTNPGPYSLNLYTDNPVIFLKATQSGSPGEASFTYNWLAACGINTNPPGAFSIIGVNTITCTAVSPTQRTLTFNPTYAGLNSQPISFSVVNELSPTTNPGPYTLNLYTDNPVVTLKATQTGTPGEASFTYNWLAACGGGSGRLGAESGAGLQVRVLGNPVNETAEVEVRGVSGQSVQLELTDIQGRVIQQHSIEEAKSIERLSLPVGGRKGLLLLRVGTPTEQKSIKLMKQ